jgi:hypothetical protein
MHDTSVENLECGSAASSLAAPREERRRAVRRALRRARQLGPEALDHRRCSYTWARSQVAPIRCAVVVAAVVVGMPLASCGGDNGPGGKAPLPTSAGGDRQQIRAEVERVAKEFDAASQAGDAEKVCRNVTAKHARSLIATFSGDTCEEAVRNARQRASAAALDARPTYSGFSTAGQTARIRVTSSSDEGQFMTNLTFRYVDGAWKIDGSGA